LYCKTEDMIADIGTKALPKLDFGERHNEKLHNGMI
jgi:hypothetical protein